MSNRRSDFDFDDDNLDFPDDDIFGRQDNDLPDLDFEEEEPRGPNRTFIIIAVVMILLFVGGLAAILFLTTREQPIPPAGLTATHIVMLNQTVEAQLRLTETQNAVNLGLTQIADAFTDTPSPSPSPTIVRSPTVTPTPTLDATILALTQLAAADLTATALAGIPTDTPTPTESTGVNPDAVALTATALALTLQAPRPTLPPEATLPGATRLPETGLYDDLTGGGAGGLGVVALMAFGLLGVIVVSRRLRASVNKPE